MSAPRQIWQPPPPTAFAEVPLGRQLRPVPALRPATATPLDSGPKVMLVIGPGGSGKTLWLRIVAELALLRDPDCDALFAAVGDRRDLGHFIPVSQPDSFEPVAETRWVEELLLHCLTNRKSAAVDFDGGDVTLTTLVGRQHDLAAMFDKVGVGLVAVYLLTSRVTDLTTLATLEQAGFQPQATLLLLNEGATDSALPFDQAFAPLQAHSVFRAAVERGAVVLRLPRLEPRAAAAVELRHIGFLAARDASHPDSVLPIDAFQRGYIARWWDELQEIIKPVVSWLP